MIHKLSIVGEEADETLYWLELLEESKLLPAGKIKILHQEASQILAMTVASIKTPRVRSQPIQVPKSKIQNPQPI